jgi:hypothetical protein
MPSSPATRSSRTLIVNLVVVALICAGVFVWWRQTRPPGTDGVTAFLNQTVGGDRILFLVEKLEPLAHDEAGWKIIVGAKARTIEPLYSKIDTAGYLAKNLRLDPTTLSEARRLLAKPDVSTQPDSQGLAPFPADPYQAVLLQVTSPAGTALVFNGVLDAHREDGAWKFTLVSGGFESGSAQGAARSSFGKNAYAVGDVADDARLHALITDFEAFGGRMADLSRNRESARVAERREAFLAQITPGQVFGGTAVAPGTLRETPLYLEITGRPSENEVRAVLRNEDSWHVVRAFQGTWSADDKFEDPVLNLTSLANEAIRNAGPVVEAAQVWRFALHVDARGELTEQNRFFNYRLAPLTPEQVRTVQARLEAGYEQAVAATEPGLLYLGTATARTSGAAETVFLRYSQRPPGNESIAATLESTTRGWKRPLRGAIMANSHRADGAPIRLQTTSGEAVGDAPTESVLRDPGELNLHLGLAQGSLVGGDEHFTYRLAPATTADLQRLEASRIERGRQLDEVLKNGIVYDGTLRDDRRYRSPVRLELIRVDRSAGTITARIRSLTRLNVFREFLGSWDALGDSIVLTTTDVGAEDKDFGVDGPFFVSRENVALRLSRTGNSLTGTIVGRPHWTMNFPADLLLSAPTETSGLPALPTKDGAYLLSNGSWEMLPSNNGHVVTEPVPDATDDEMAALMLQALRQPGGGKDPVPNSKRKIKDMVSYFEFDGKTPPPVARGAPLVLVFVGPESTGEPAIELAPARILADGKRRIKLSEIAPKTVRLGDQRAAAYVRPVAPDVLLLTTTSAIPPGNYIVNAGAGYELLRK